MRTFETFAVQADNAEMGGKRKFAAHASKVSKVNS